MTALGAFEEKNSPGIPFGILDNLAGIESVGDFVRELRRHRNDEFAVRVSLVHNALLFPLLLQPTAVLQVNPLDVGQPLWVTCGFRSLGIRPRTM